MKEEEDRAYLDVGLGPGAWDLVPGVCVRMTLMCRPATSRLEQQLSQSRTGRTTGGVDGRTVRQQEQGRRGQEQRTQVTQPSLPRCLGAYTVDSVPRRARSGSQYGPVFLGTPRGAAVWRLGPDALVRWCGGAVVRCCGVAVGIFGPGEALWLVTRRKGTRCLRRSSRSQSSSPSGRSGQVRSLASSCRGL